MGVGCLPQESKAACLGFFLMFHMYISVIHAGLTSVFQIYQISALFEVFALIVELVSVQSTRTQIIMQHNIS